MGVTNLTSVKQTPDNLNAERFVSSKLFANLFAHGMELVDETATYLDGEGREAAKKLSRQSALSYAGISMRLTTKLMQIASWLLVLRALREGEMSYQEAAQDKYRLGTPESEHSLFKNGEDERNYLPETLLELLDETDNLYSRINRIDHDIFTDQIAVTQEGDASSQLRALQKAFSDK